MRYITLAAAIIVCMLLSSCCKEGLDGKATVNATIMHHDSLVRGATVYIRFDSKEAAADLSEYDAVYTADAASGTITIQNLKCGDYFFFVKGYHAGNAVNVRGGVSYSIRHADRKSDIDITIPVSEE